MLKPSLCAAALALPLALFAPDGGEGAATALASEAVYDVTTELTAEPVALGSGELGCRITVKAKNGYSSDIWLVSEQSRVRAKVKVLGKSVWGTWKKMPMSNRRIRSGETATMSAELTFNCNSYRQYEFLFKRGSNTAWKKYGGTAGTTRTSLDLGDANTLF